MSQLYATAAEFQNHPTGLNTTNLVAGGSSAQQTAELELLMQLAAQHVEQWTYQPLYARAVTEQARLTPNAYGELTLITNFAPVRSVASAQWRRWQSEPFQSLTVTDADVYRKKIVFGGEFGQYRGWGNPPLTLQATYVAGYANAVLTAACAQSATTLSLDDATGVVAGTALTVYDGANQEVVTVSSISGNDVTLSSATLFAHDAGVRASEVPAAVTLAAILTTGYLIKERRAGGGIMMGGKIQEQNVAGSEDLQMARQMLAPFRIVQPGSGTVVF